MLLVLEYGRIVARKVPVFLYLNNQLVASFLSLLTVRFRTPYVLFYTFFCLRLFISRFFISRRRHKIYAATGKRK